MINPSASYPGQTAADANYPQGKARNITATGDTSGTPFEATWLNDLWGWMQALVSHAGITPSGSPDSVAASQLLDAVCAASWIGVYAVTTGVATALGALFGLTQTSQFGGFSLVSNAVQVPAAGKYRATLSGVAKSSGTANPSSVYVLVQSGSTGIDVVVYRPTASASDFVMLNLNYVFTITNPASQQISVVANSTGSTLQFAGTPQLTIERVG